jgi:hypothetical protein
MDNIRVMPVDDAAVVRRPVANALNRDPALEVVGTSVAVLRRKGSGSGVVQGVVQLSPARRVRRHSRW